MESDSETWSDMHDEYWDGDSYYDKITEQYKNDATNIEWKYDINRYDYI